MMCRIVAAALAALILAVLVTAADAGKWSHQGFDAYHKRQQQIRAQQQPMTFDNDGRVRSGGAMPEFSRLPFRYDRRVPVRHHAARARSTHRVSAARHGSREHVAEPGVSATAPSGDPLIQNARRYIGGNPTGWTHQWCGVFMRMIMRAAGLPDLPSGNEARAWAHYGRPSSPKPGAIVVWPHHVALITAVRSDGTAIIISGNDWGRKVRERPRSIAHAIAIRLPSG